MLERNGRGTVDLLAEIYWASVESKLVKIVSGTEQNRTEQSKTKAAPKELSALSAIKFSMGNQINPSR